MTNSQFILLVLWCAGELVVSAARSHPLPALALRLHRTARAPGQTRRRSMSSAGSPELAPAFTGYGTHYVYLYVGTPAQRQSVIIDTGSHFTAFPCTGCSNCGSHTDPYYDLDKSNTESIPLCGGSKCLFSQSYAEGSSWHAYKVVDKIWVGGSSADEVANGDLYQVDYTFGCQTSEAGLFKTQLENGIMVNYGSFIL